jgi:hypothetical protein
MGIEQGFPQITSPLVNPETGRIDQAWMQLLITLWNRTGGGSGDFVVAEDFAADLFFQDAQDAAQQDDLFLLDGADPADSGCLFDSWDDTLPQTVAPEFFSDLEQTIVALPPDMSDAIEQPLQVYETVTVGASPFTFTANLPGDLLVVGGTVSQIDIDRKGTSLTTGLTAGFFPVMPFDQCTITYSGLPTVYFLPR